MSYWIFNGTPWNKRGYSKLADARKAAMKKLIENDRENVQIVRADDPPYDWKKNYTVIGTICAKPGWTNPEFQWYSKDSEPKWITQTGNLGSVIPRNMRMWHL